MSPIVQMLFSFEGRMRRRDFWLCHLGLCVAQWLLQTVVLAVVWPFTSFSVVTYGDAPLGIWSSWVSSPWMHAWPVISLINLALLWPRIALGVKRYHDRDKSGLWLLIGLVPFFGWLWLLIELGFLDGTPGPNRYGPSPKQAGGPAPAPAAG